MSITLDNQTCPFIATPVSLTFIQPVTEPVEDDALLAGRHQTNGAALHGGAIVDVVLENEDLQEPERGGRHLKVLRTSVQTAECACVGLHFQLCGRCSAADPG